jgi:hypothetical protein
MEELKSMLMDELEEVTEKGKLTAGDLDTVDKLTHSIKSIETILAMKGYSYDYPSYYGRKRDSMGRYSRNYSYGKESIMHSLREMMNDAENDKEREAIRKCMDEIDVH